MRVSDSLVRVVLVALGFVLASAGAASCSSTGDSSPQTGGDASSQGRGPDATAPIEAASSPPSESGASNDGPGAPDGGGGVDSGTDPDLPCYALGVPTLACEQCCGQHHTTGEPIYSGAFDTCICGPPDGASGPCDMACAQTDCSSAPDAAPAIPGDPCSTCEAPYLADGGQCANQINAACQRNPDCMRYANCIDQCP
jgi:hypothetical protein